VLAGVPQVDDVRFSPGLELELLAPQPSLGLGDRHAFPGAGLGEVGFELSNHGQHAEQQSSDRIGRRVRKWTDVMFFFLSTKMLPVVAGLLPIYLFAQNTKLLDNIWLLIVLYTSMNLPIAVWMMRSFLAEVPVEMLEAAALDGAGLSRTLRQVIAPVVLPGIAATSLICFIFSWNELLFARVLTGTVATTAPVFLTSFVTSQGLFLAKVCAAAVVVSLPVIIAGFAAQDKLVQGLSLGAVK